MKRVRDDINSILLVYKTARAPFYTGNVVLSLEG